MHGGCEHKILNANRDPHSCRGSSASPFQQIQLVHSHCTLVSDRLRADMVSKNEEDVHD